MRTVLAIGLAVSLGSRVPLAEAQDLERLLGRDEADDAEVEPRPEPAPTEPPAEAARERRVVEEIIVTAQKREQSLHEVPLSISVIDDEFLNQESLTDLSELSRHVPNVRVLPAAFSPRANIRGFGVDEVSGGNKSVESPIGMAIDGVSYGNKHYLQTGFLDLDRIEVLRGPQNTLFGKNNSVGLFNLVTKNPTDEFTGFVDVELGEPERRRFEGAIGGPALPGFLNFRLAAVSEGRDGFKRNTTARVVPEAFDSLVAFDRKAFRVKAEVPDLLGANLVLSYEKFALDVFGIGLEFAIVPESTRSFYREFDPDTDFDYGDRTLSTDFPSVTRIDIDTFVANASYDLGEWGLNAVVGHSVLETDNQVDPDTGPIPMLTAFASDSNPQTTFELRTTSPELPGLFGLERALGRALGWTDFTAGLFYQRRQVLDSEFTAAFDTALVGAFAVLTGASPPAGAPTPPTPITRQAVGSTIESTTMFWEETSNTIAGYGQTRWHFGERWTLTGGLRLGNEWKEADWNRVLEGSPPVFLTAGGFEEFTAHESRSELQHAPQVNLRYDVMDDVNVFAGWARGFRGGGLNEFALRNENLEFDPEAATSWELGTNAELLGGAARTSLALFRTTITDFQLVTQGPETRLIEITKAGKARSQGVESDAVWLPTDWLTVRGTFAFIDTEFLDFPLGPCTLDRPNTDGDDETRCDLSGGPLPRAPRWVTTLTPSVRIPLARLPLVPTRGIDFVGALTMEYQDAHFLDLTLDRRTRQPSFFRFDGNVGIDDPARGWSLRVTMMNLTDELVTDTAREVTLARGHFVWSAIDPRHVFGEFRWGW
ncbi:MAG: TonB-dependent receptor [Candidatus Binatia bacterium]